MSNDDDSYTFVVEWYDSVADLTKKYNLTFWPKDSSLSMYDISKNRLFLKRLVHKDIKFPNDLYKNKTIVVYSRQLKIIDYADIFTRNKFNKISNEYNILFVGINSFNEYMQKITQNFNKSSFDFKNIKSVYSNNEINKYLNIIKSNEMLIYCEFVGNDDILKQFNECNVNNNFSGFIVNNLNNESKIITDYINESASSAKLNQNDISSLCLIKPHSLSSISLIINDILSEGFNITAITTKKLTLTEAKDFYEIYKDVVKEYNYLIEDLLSGTVIALQIDCNSLDHTSNQFDEFREFVGPKDPEIAKYIRPHTLRAKYGIDRVKNGIHCTDLQEDGILESKFFFEILNKN